MSSHLPLLSSKFRYLDLGEWFHVPKLFVKKLPILEAMVLAAVFHLTRKKKTLWVRLPTHSIQNHYSISSGRVRRALKSLVEMNLMKTRLEPRGGKKGGGLTRSVRIRAGEFLKLITRVDYSTVLKSHRGNNRTRDISPLRGDIPPNGLNKKKSKPLHIKRVFIPKWKEFGNQLLQMVSAVRKVPKNARPGTWGQSFRTIYHRYEVSPEKIQQVLTWYAKTLEERGDLIPLRDHYIPIAYSGPRFLEKWEKLEMAMERSEAERKKTHPQIKVSRGLLKGKLSKEDRKNCYNDTW